MRGGLRTGGSTSVTTHGQAFRGLHTGAYKAWRSILVRLKHDPGYVGVQICDEWKTFQGFYACMGDRPEGASVGRKDNSKGYSPENCQWETPRQQANNRRSNRLLELDGQVLTLAQWSGVSGLKQSTISMRINTYGWDVKRALTTPPQQ